MLNRYLDGLTSYAETVVWNGHDSDTNYDSDSETVKDSPQQALDPSTTAAPRQAVSSGFVRNPSVPVTSLRHSQIRSVEPEQQNEDRGSEGIATEPTAPIELPTSSLLPQTIHPGDQVRRRPNVQFACGTYLLGKTIGAGSKGKVKLGENEQTGEVVRIRR
jgi:hypothetical protein